MTSSIRNKIPSQRPSVFAIDGQIYSSMNSSQRPPVPEGLRSRPLPSEYLPDPRDVLAPRWADNRYPKLGFIPVKPRFTKPFHILRNELGAESRFDFCIHQTKGRFHGTPSLMMRWKRLEENLAWLVSSLETEPASLSSLYEESFPLPYRFGYLRDHATKRIAASCIKRSREAFLPLMAHCSYLLFVHNFTYRPQPPPTIRKNDKPSTDLAENGPQPLIQTKGPEPPVVHWEFVISKVGTNAPAIAEIKQSELVDFSPENERMGYLINQSFLPKNSTRNMALRLKSLPVWICWGPSPNADRMPEFKSWCPTKEEIIVALSAEKKRLEDEALAEVARLREPAPVDFGPPDDEAEISKDDGWNTPPYVSDFPTGQRPGESLESFFARRTTAREQRLAVETPKQRESRLSRAEHASKQKLPGKGATIFRWTKNRITGAWLRVHVTHSTVKDWWSEFAPSQRRFNNINKEWDLCRGFDETAIPEHEFDEDEDIPDYDNDLTIPTFEEDQPLQPPRPSVWQADDSSYIQIKADDIRGVDTNVTLDTLLYTRFGFINSGILQISEPLKPAWEKVRILLGYRHGNLDANSSTTDIHQFIHLALATPPNAPLSLPPHIWDLALENCQQFVTNRNPRLKIVRAIISSKEHYVISARDKTASPLWNLVLDNATTALECIRNQHENVLEVASWLVSSGRPFRTLLSQKLISPQCRHRLPTPSLGWKLEQLKPTAEEYTAYELCRAQLLHQGRGRAALLKGGIIWRLAVETLGDRALDIVLDGPSSEVLTYGDELLSGDDHLWDDTLNEQLLNLICGVYRVFNGNGNQCTDLSWWPKQSTFEASGLNVGFWSPDCEEWFIKRRREIAEGSATFKSADQWYRTLTYCKKDTKQLALRHDLAGHNFICRFEHLVD